MKTNRCFILISSVILLAIALSPLASPAWATPAITFTVNTGSDGVDILPGDGVCENAPGSGICTLRAAIMEANAHIGADTIILPAVECTLTIPGADEDLGATGDLDITESLTITGDGEYTTFIKANGLGDRVFEIHASAVTVSMTGLQIFGGAAIHGGGIDNNATLNLSNTIMIQNQSNSSGGGIFSWGVLNLSNVTILNSLAKFGSAIGAAGTLFITGSTFNHNHATVDGGAIYLGTVLAKVKDVHIEYNTADGRAGGIFNNGGTLWMENSTVYSNTAISDGGGIFNNTSMNTGTISLASVELSKNIAAQGGAIYNVGDLTIEDSIVQTNTVTGNGGGLYNDTAGKASISNVQFVSNHSDIYGGAISNHGTMLALSYSDVKNNSAGYGGGIANSLGGSITLSHINFENNFSEGSGGGMRNEGGNLDIADSLFMANSANGGGGLANCCNGIVSLSATYFLGNDGAGYGGAILHMNTGSMIDATGIQCADNQANYGGAIWMVDGASITINQSEFYHNFASTSGGAIAISYSGMILTNSSVISNTATSNGGGIYNDGLLAIDNSTLSDNKSFENGGGIANTGVASVNNSTLTHNGVGESGQPANYGGGVYVFPGSTFTFGNSILFGNHSIYDYQPDDCYGNLTTQGYNLIGVLDANCSLNNDQGLDIIGEDPLLSSLADNGGPTQTHALQAGSPAIDSANPAGCIGSSGNLLTTDQRGYLRKWDGDGNGVPRCDIGAFEYGSVVQLFLPIALK